MPQNPDPAKFDGRFSQSSLRDTVVNKTMLYFRPTSKIIVEAKFSVTSQKPAIPVLMVIGIISLTSCQFSQSFKN